MKFTFKEMILAQIIASVAWSLTAYGVGVRVAHEEAIIKGVAEWRINAKTGVKTFTYLTKEEMK